MVPRKKKRVSITKEEVQITPQEGVTIENNIVKTGRGLFQIKALMTQGGKIIATFSPLQLKLDLRDIAQIFIGSIILASPFMVTEEVWQLGEQLPIFNSVLLMLLTLFTLTILLYYTRYHKISFEGHIVKKELIRRLVVTYFISFSTVAIIMTILGKAPWDANSQVAIKRIILITLPASIGGAAVDLLK